jgi:zinc transport system permease protein
MSEILGYQFVQNAIVAGALASLLCGLVGTFVVVKRLVFVSGGVSHAAFGGLGIFYYLGWPPLAGAAASALLAALVLSGRTPSQNRSQDALIGILWAVGMAVGVLFMARTPGFAPNLATYLFGDILAVSRPLLVALAVFVAVVLLGVTLFFKELLAVAFDEEFARSQGVRTRAFLLVLMALIALSVVLLIQVVGVILAIALLTIPPVTSLAVARSFRSVIVLAVVVALLMTMAGLALSFAWNLPSGPTIVLLGFALLLVVRSAEHLRRRPVRR